MNLRDENEKYPVLRNMIELLKVCKRRDRTSELHFCHDKTTLLYYNVELVNTLYEKAKMMMSNVSEIVTK